MSLCPLLSWKYNCTEIYSSLFRWGSGALLFVLQLQNSNVSGPKSQQVQTWLFPVYLGNFLKKKKKKVMNGLFRDGSSGQNTQTPRDRHKRCYSLKLLTHRAASRSYMWHIMCGDPKNTVVSINSLSTVSDQTADLLFHPAERQVFLPVSSKKQLNVWLKTLSGDGKQNELHVWISHTLLSPGNLI